MTNLTLAQQALNLLLEQNQQLAKFSETLNKLDMDECEFIDNNTSELEELFQTGAVTITIDNKQISFKLLIEGF